MAQLPHDVLVMLCSKLKAKKAFDLVSALRCPHLLATAWHATHEKDRSISKYLSSPPLCLK